MRHSGAFFFEYFLLGMQKKVLGRRATPGITTNRNYASAEREKKKETLKTKTK